MWRTASSTGITPESLKKAAWQDHVGVVAQAQLTGQTVGVHDIELHVVAGDVLLDVAGQLLRQLLLGPGGVQQEGTAVLISWIMS